MDIFQERKILSINTQPQLRENIDIVTSMVLERIGLLCFVGLYLVIFNVEVPHGDALRISGQIESNELLWNPNHILLDWFGYVWSKLIQIIGIDLSILAGFELISAVATLISVYLFHRILLQIGVKDARIRVLVVIGLFSSKNFLSMAVSQYFFMLQMPFLLGALHFAIRFAKELETGLRPHKSLIAMGVLMAIATGIEFNNIIPVIFIGIVLGMAPNSQKYWRYGNTLSFWTAAAVVGFPVFVLAYLLSDTDSSFVAWLLAYAGESDTSLDNYYGTQLSPASVLTGGATLVFHFFFGNIIETAGLGTVIKVVVTQEPLEFVPDVTKLVLASLLIPIVGISVLRLSIWGLLRTKQNMVIRICMTWLAAYLVFNFLWPYSADLFWFQLLPLIWVLLAIYLRDRAEFNMQGIQVRGQWMHRKLAFMSLIVLCLLVLNTMQTVVPLAMADMDSHQNQHNNLLRDGDLEIVPGWDDYKWMMLDDSQKKVTRLLLMNMALRPDQDALHISRLPELIIENLNAGNRVLIGRLYDLDREPNPWYGLAGVGWPRWKIQELIGDFCTRPVGTVADVGFHELHFCLGSSEAEDNDIEKGDP